MQDSHDSNRGSHRQGKIGADTVFIDFRAAFDLAPRNLIVETLAKVGVPPKFLRLLCEILQANEILLDDSVSLLGLFRQTTEFPRATT